MRRRDTLLTFLLVGVFLISFVSAGWFSDTWNFLTGKVVSNNDLIAQWSFEDNYKDSISGLELSKSGSVSFVEGYSGKAVSFNQGYLFSSSSVGSGKPRTYALMVKTADPTQNYKLMGTAALQSTGGWVLGAQYPEAWNGSWSVEGGAFENCSTDNSLRSSLFKSNEWVSIVVTYDDLAFKEYINGVLVKTCVSSKKNIGTGTRFEIGKVPFWGANFVGLIDEVKIFNKALTESEVKELASASVQPVETCDDLTEDFCDGYNYYNHYIDYESKTWGGCELVDEWFELVEENSPQCGYVVECPQISPLECEEGTVKECEEVIDSLDENGCPIYPRCSCVQSNITDSLCTDSDGGVNHEVKGIAVGPWYGNKSDIRNVSDSCSGTQVHEYFCSSGSSLNDYYSECPNGCVDGACSNISFNESIMVSNLSKSCKNLISNKGFLFSDIGKYNLERLEKAPYVLYSENLSNIGEGNVSADFFNYRYYYVLRGPENFTEAVLKVELNLLKSEEPFSKLLEFEKMINSTLWTLKEYEGSEYYSFLTSGETDLVSYSAYTRENFLIVVSLISRNKNLDKELVDTVIQKYLNVCPSDVSSSCVPKWSESIEPVVCPASGVQQKIFTDLNNCEPKVIKDLSCEEGSCGGCKENDKCYPISYRLGDRYCDFEGFVTQKLESSKCNNNFECSTNLCVDGACVSSNLWQKIVSFFKAIFNINLIKALGENI